MSASGILLMVCLVAAHVLADFPLQADWMVRGKKRFVVLLQHGLTHALVALAMLLPAFGFSGVLIPIVLVIAIAHMAIDRVKVSSWVEDQFGVDSLAVFLVDQLVHLMTIGLVFLLVRDWLPSPHVVVWKKYAVNVLALTGLLVSIFAGSPVIGMLTRESRAQLNPTIGLPHAGKMIGMLERTLVYLLVLGGSASGVGFLIAAKSIFRFGRSEDAEMRKESEYIIIGTLASFAFALAVAFLALKLMKWITEMPSAVQ